MVIEMRLDKSRDSGFEMTSNKKPEIGDLLIVNDMILGQLIGKTEKALIIQKSSDGSNKMFQDNAVLLDKELASRSWIQWKKNDTQYTSSFLIASPRRLMRAFFKAH